MQDLLDTVHRIDRGQNVELALLVVICVILANIYFKMKR